MPLPLSRSYCIPGPHEADTTTATTTARSAAATTKTTATNTTTTAAGPTATSVFVEWSAGYSATATGAGHDATSAACVIGARANEPSGADATSVPKPVPAKLCE